MLARRDREAQRTLVERRRAAGLRQSDIDRAFGFPDGWAHSVEAYDSDPSLSDRRRYEAIITLHEQGPTMPERRRCQSGWSTHAAEGWHKTTTEHDCAKTSGHAPPCRCACGMPEPANEEGAGDE